jgi:hypothetical protein
MWKTCEISDFLGSPTTSPLVITKKYHGCTIKGCHDEVSRKPAEIDEGERLYKDHTTRSFLSWKPFRKNKYCVKHWWAMACDVKILAEKKKHKWFEKHENTLFLNGSGDLYTSKNIFICNMTKTNHARLSSTAPKAIIAVKTDIVYDDLVSEVIDDDTSAKDDHNPDDEDGQYEDAEDDEDTDCEIEDDIDGLDDECF